MKNIFFSIKIKTIIVFLLVVIISTILVTCVTLKVNTANAKPLSNCAVVIDAGHGGIDGGSIGKNYGSIESKLNLEYAKELAKQLKSMNISYVFTRSNDNGLYDKNATSLKKSDMKKRKEIIENVKPLIVVSIHMNSFSSSNVKGAQAFYKKDNEQGKVLADIIQKQLKNNLSNTNNSQGKVGDYFIVNCTNIPAVLIECGFLSNEEDEKLLITNSYKVKICYSILSGIVAFLNG